MKSNKSILAGIGVAIILIALIVVKLVSNKKTVEEKIYIPEVDAPVLVEVVNPSWYTFEDEFSYLGVFDPFRQNIIGSEGSGRVVSININEGDFIGSGSLIASLDDELIKLQIENLEVSIEGQENDDARYSTLANQNAVPAIQAEKTKLAIKAAKIQMKQLQKQLKSSQIRAPFAGTITKKLIDLGSVIGPGSPVAEITDITKLKLTVNIPERDIQKFKLNQSINVTSDNLEETLNGKIINIAVQADKSHNFKVQILINNSKKSLRAGMYGLAVIKSETSITSLSIPRKAIVGSLKNPQVYVVRNGKAMLVSCAIGLTEKDVIEVRSGLQIKDKIVVRGQINLKNNKNVKIAQ
jgi:RND family efflux transporter MFP subunit